MIYIKDADPENAIDFPDFNEVCGVLSDEWHENDQDFVIEAMADWLSGLQDSYATTKLANAIKARAESIIERSKE